MAAVVAHSVGLLRMQCARGRSCAFHVAWLLGPGLHALFSAGSPADHALMWLRRHTDPLEVLRLPACLGAVYVMFRPQLSTSARLASFVQAGKVVCACATLNMLRTLSGMGAGRTPTATGIFAQAFSRTLASCPSSCCRPSRGRLRPRRCLFALFGRAATGATAAGSLSHRERLGVTFVVTHLGFLVGGGFERRRLHDGATRLPARSIMSVFSVWQALSRGACRVVRVASFLGPSTPPTYKALYHATQRAMYAMAGVFGPLFIYARVHRRLLVTWLASPGVRIWWPSSYSKVRRASGILWIGAGGGAPSGQGDAWHHSDVSTISCWCRPVRPIVHSA